MIYGCFRLTSGAGEGGAPRVKAAGHARFWGSTEPPRSGDFDKKSARFSARITVTLVYRIKKKRQSIENMTASEALIQHFQPDEDVERAFKSWSLPRYLYSQIHCESSS
jgi:hypothetical protein